ncbi:oxidoreductase [Sulfitobacter sp. BDSS02]|nr:oxidoreductase [Sulfitobacter sp. BDSS02]MBR9848913.1 oxidoreductase [Paracoccaceae bacterium]
MSPPSLFDPLELPCGTVLRNRIVKSAMSDSLGDGQGSSTAEQIRLYRRWAEGGAAATIIGEVQGRPDTAEKPGNLVLSADSPKQLFGDLAMYGGCTGCVPFVQLGHAGAMAYPPISHPVGPSALDLPGVQCEALTVDEILALPEAFAVTARLVRDMGFGGVQIHAAHGFLLSQFLSPLFNRRTDGWGGSLGNRMRLLIDTITAMRQAVGPDFPIAVKLNATDQLQGGLTEAESIRIVAALDKTGVDLIDITGGTYFPGAASASDAKPGQPYFIEFSRRAKQVTTIPVMLTGGIKTRAQAMDVLESGAADMVGLARALVLNPDLPTHWQKAGNNPVFPRFADAPEGGVTAWFTEQIAALGRGGELDSDLGVHEALASYTNRDEARIPLWNAAFTQ